MLINAIEGCTRRLGKAQGYISLPIRDTVLPDGTPIMLSSWQPLPDEIARLTLGAPIVLGILGTEHPPVILKVGDFLR